MAHLGACQALLWPDWYVSVVDRGLPFMSKLQANCTTKLLN